MFLDKSQFEPSPPCEQVSPEPAGPRRFLQIIQSDFFTLVKLNLLLLLCCLPVVTLPPALFAAHRLTRRVVLDEPVRCWRDFRAAFRGGWKQGYAAFLLTAVPVGLSGSGAAFYLRHAQQLPLLVVPFALCVFVFLVSLLSSTYLYALLCDGRPWKEAVRTAVLLAAARPLRAVLAALGWHGLTLAGVLFFPLSGPYLTLIGLILPVLLGHFFARTVLRQYCGR